MRRAIDGMFNETTYRGIPGHDQLKTVKALQ